MRYEPFSSPTLSKPDLNIPYGIDDIESEAVWSKAPSEVADFVSKQSRSVLNFPIGHV